MQNVIFFGSDQYSAIVLSTLLESKTCHITSIITDRGKPKDREQLVESNPVEKLVITHNLKVSYYPDFDHSLVIKDTLGLCASFDHLLPKEIIDLFGGNLFNLHPSLLPQYRNVSPVQYAIALGDRGTGITLFRITTGIDNGKIIAQVAEPIHPDDTTPTLSARLFPLGADLFLRFLGSDLKGSAQPRSNNLRGRSDPIGNLIFTHRLTRDSGFIEWPVLLKLINNETISPAETVNELLRLRLTHNSKGNILSDLLRSLYPWPGVWTTALTKKGDLRLTLKSIVPNVTIKLAGKPNPIAWSDFKKYYMTL